MCQFLLLFFSSLLRIGKLQKHLNFELHFLTKFHQLKKRRLFHTIYLIPISYPKLGAGVHVGGVTAVDGDALSSNKYVEDGSCRCTLSCKCG